MIGLLHISHRWVDKKKIGGERGGGASILFNNFNEVYSIDKALENKYQK